MFYLLLFLYFLIIYYLCRDFDKNIMYWDDNNTKMIGKE